MLSYRVGRVGRNPCHRHTERARGFQIDVIEACAAKRDQLDALFRQKLQSDPVKSIIHEGTDRIMPRCERGGFVTEPGLEKGQLVIRPGRFIRCAQEFPIVCS